MPVLNSDVARIFGPVPDLLETEGTNSYRVRAYRNAARTIAVLPGSIADMVGEGDDLTKLEGVGEDVAGKIEEIITTGSLKQLQEIEQRTPSVLADMLDLPGLGPKCVYSLYEKLGITSLAELEKAVQEGKVEQLEGFGEKTQQNILQALQEARSREKRVRIDMVEEQVAPLLAYLHEIDGVQRVNAAGSYRRRQETVGDLDILSIGDDGQLVIDRFVEHEDVHEVAAKGETRCTVLLRTGLQVDLRVVKAESYGAARLYFTGSKPHNIRLRNMALDQDLKINEYGVFRGEERIAGETEKGIYALFGLPYTQPELREERGEIGAAREGRLPQLVTVEDLRGDLAGARHGK